MTMDLGALILTSAMLLSLERICYAWAWHRTSSFLQFCATSVVPDGLQPTEVLEGLFYFFKVVQLSVFVFWCFHFGGGQLWPPPAPAEALGAGAGAILLGQALNFSVFRRLGRTGVFYGARFGYRVTWVKGFPFSLVKHPQYVGAVLTIWGFFLIMRFPCEDWAILPALSSLYYALGAHVES